MTTLWLLYLLSQATATAPAPLLTRLVDIAQVLMVPIGTFLCAAAWSIWSKVTAMYTVLFGRPEIKEDDGLVGRMDSAFRMIDRCDRDLERLCENAGIPRAEARE